MKKVFQNILLLCAALSILLVLLELGIRMFDPQPKYYAPQNLFTADPLLGYKLTPNFDGYYSTPESKVKFQVNSRGLRDYEHGEKKGTRILGLGDSFVMGVGVELKDTFLAKLEKQLNLKKNRKPFEVIKTGVQGYGTKQELHFLKKTGWEYKPDLAILCFYPNDVLDNILPTFTVKNGYVVRNVKTLPKELKKKKLFGHRNIAHLIENDIHLFRFIINRLKNNSTFRNLFLKLTDETKKSRKKRIEIYARNPGKIIQNAYEITKKLLLEMKNETMANNAKFLVVYIPERLQVYRDQWESVKKQWEIDDINYDNSRPDKVLSVFCQENDISFINLLPILISHVEKGEELYFKLDPHLTVKGNEITATAIYKKITEDGLISPKF